MENENEKVKQVQVVVVLVNQVTQRKKIKNLHLLRSDLYHLQLDLQVLQINTPDDIHRTDNIQDNMVNEINSRINMLLVVVLNSIPISRVSIQGEVGIRRRVQIQCSLVKTTCSEILVEVRIQALYMDSPNINQTQVLVHLHQEKGLVLDIHLVESSNFNRLLA